MIAAKYTRSLRLLFHSLASGQYATYETLSSWSFLFANGLGNVEYGISVSFLDLEPIGIY